MVAPCIVRWGVGVEGVSSLGVWTQRGVVGEVVGHGGTGGGGGDVAGFAGGLALPPFRAAVLEPDLDAGLAEIELQGQFLSGEDVGVRGALEGFL